MSLGSPGAKPYRGHLAILIVGSLLSLCSARYVTPSSASPAPMQPYALALSVAGGLPGNILLEKGRVDFTTPCDDGGPDCCPRTFSVLSIRRGRAEPTFHLGILKSVSEATTANFLSNRDPLQLPLQTRILIGAIGAEAHATWTEPSKEVADSTVTFSLEVGPAELLSDRFTVRGPFELLKVATARLTEADQPEVLLAFTSYRSFMVRIYSVQPARFLSFNKMLDAMRATINDQLAQGGGGGSPKTECQALEEFIASMKARPPKEK